MPGPDDLDPVPKVPTAPPEKALKTQQVVKFGGVPFRVQGQDQLISALEKGGQLTTPEAGIASEQARRDQAYVDQNWGVAGKLGAGLTSGLTLGLGPGVASRMGLVDPGHLMAAQQSPYYTGGDIAGTILPALLSGGESLGARGALRLTPAGLLEMAGSATERGLGEVLGTQSGVLGRFLTTPARMAARGAVEGAAINLGHTVGQNLIDNVPLSSEALWASGVDGILAGGLLGAGLGTVGSIGSLAAESAGGLFKKGLSNSRIANGLLSRRLGYAAGDVEAATEAAGGDLGAHWGEVNKVMKKGETSIGDSDVGMLTGLKRARDTINTERNAAIDELDKLGPNHAPKIERIVHTAETTVTNPRLGTPDETLAKSVLSDFRGKWENISPPTVYEKTKVPPVTEERYVGSKAGRDKYGKETSYTPSKTETIVKEPGYELPGGRVASNEAPSWKKLVAARDQLATEIEGLGKTPSQQIKLEILKTVDSELRSAMEYASKTNEGLAGVADKYGAATTQLKLAEVLTGSVGSRNARKVLGEKPAFSTNEAAYAGLMMAHGALWQAPTFLLGKAVVKLAGERFEPVMAQMAMNMAIGQKAAAAASSVKSQIGSAVKNFFSAASKGPVKTGYTVKAENFSRRKETGFDRVSFEANMSRTEALLSSAHQERVRKLTEDLAKQGYQELAVEMVGANARAVQYLSNVMPVRMGSKNLSSLRPTPAPKNLSRDEYMFKRIEKAITKPISILEDMNNGSLSRDSMNAFKYVYPAMHAQVVQSAAEHIYETKAAGKFLPMDKISMLGLVLGAPVDSTQEPEYIQSVQMALNTPTEAPQNAPGRSSVGQGSMSTGPSADFMTVSQKVQAI